MKLQKLGVSGLDVSSIALGCMRMSELDVEKATAVIEQANQSGINFYDHADIYGGGESEKIFSQALAQTNMKREDIIIQSKAGIRKGFFDFSKAHIMDAVEGSLKRLNTDYLDVLLLHRPDTLVEPEEVNEAFYQLEKTGKVRHFGVNNQNPMQIELLKRDLETDLVANQLQLSLKHTGMIDQGFQVNMKWDGASDRDGSILDYSRLNDMTIQAWSPFQFGYFDGVFVDHPDFPELNQALKNIAEKYQVTKSAIAISWILRHPAKIQAVIGSMNPERIGQIVKASDIKLTREEWYELYRAAGNELP